MNIDLPALLVGAILLAGLYATMSYGLALIYGVMKIVNLAHAGVMMWGAYLAFIFIVNLGMNPFLAPVLIVPVFFFLGILLQRYIVRRVMSVRLRNGDRVASRGPRARRPALPAICAPLSPGVTPAAERRPASRPRNHPVRHEETRDRDDPTPENHQLRDGAPRVLALGSGSSPDERYPGGRPRHRQGSLHLRLPDGRQLSHPARLLRGPRESRVQGGLEPDSQFRARLHA